ncbi:hypothetical protein [Flavobacterium hercynium]|uniref:Uncharacterized protein n=1 Tax=Flavobacterium hercynium TaxID=387094 RepID=A0A226HA69_9FLAO|nr:hypothetical protein [Flavobacterium hercynium]OXA91082.1 hypothetical protein B0A66_11930 [Flavobacterium hercynium]SMP36696.1 YD repeat-containing protein [Flavobacterium hercynium]
MTKYHKRHRFIATFFLLIIFPTIFPVDLFASTNGPVAPESTSFEPVDATDMVNLATGDLSYVMPLLDVPSPEGGYPLTLSYHAGIASDQDASWVGLGWSLNPGAINRAVSGYPDDWKQENVSSIVFDPGGEISQHNFSVGVGLGSGKYTVGLYGSYSENKAFGGQNSYNFDGGVNASGYGLDVSTGSDGSSISATADIKMNSTGRSSSTNSNNSTGINLVNYTGSHRSTQSSSYSVRQVGDRVGVDINVFLFQINYSFSKLRYHYFDTNKDIGVGTLYSNNLDSAKNSTILSKVGFDTYTANYDQSDESLIGNNIILPTYDFYSVSGQGITGDISPKILEYGTLTPKTETFKVDGIDFKNLYYNRNPLNKNLNSNDLHFYFNNTYESYINIDSDKWDGTPATILEGFTNVDSPTSSLNSTVNIDGNNFNGYNSENKRKRGSSYIETYTNQQIISNPNLIYNLKNFNRTTTSIPKDGIGAFKITTPDGKTYHYTLPVYQKEKFSRSSKYDEDISNKFYEEFQVAPYATHWLLTAITGSDFVDDGDGTINDKDLGYWVTFEYGKWSDGYTWRTPRGSDYKITPTSKLYEWGIKEIYYLDAIKTRTHTALFVKNERSDAISIPESTDKEYTKNGKANKLGFYDLEKRLYYLNVLGSFPTMKMAVNHEAIYTLKTNYKKEQHTLLKLDKIIVVKNKDIPLNFRNSNPSEQLSKVTATINMSESGKVGYSDGTIDEEINNSPIYNSRWSGEFYSNVLDNKDIDYYFPNVQNYSTKTIDFSYDYSLAKGTPNGVNSTFGRLTLNKLTYKGKNGIQVLPPYVFQYENPNQQYNVNNSDDWGFNKSDATAWNLNRITHPTGANISIKYEEDDYYTEAVKYENRFKNDLKFTFSKNSDKLRFVVENLDPNNSYQINFPLFFTVNQKAKVNIWAGILHEYRDFSCYERKGSVDIEDKEVDVVAVSDTSVTFETDLEGNTTNSDGGLDLLFNTQYSYEMARLHTKKRNEFPDLSGGCSDRTAYTFLYSIYSNKVNTDQNGGGLRVKQITVNANEKNYNTNYYYNQDGYSQSKGDLNYKSSGITSYAPSNYEKNIKYMAELPPPSVMYNTVKVETDQDITKYYFKTVSPEVVTSKEYSLGEILKIKKIQNEDDIPLNITTFSNPKLTKYKYDITNNFAMMGALIKQERYNKSNQLLKKLENNYIPTSKIKQGLVKETFNSYKNSYTENKDIGKYEGFFHLNISSKTTYPTMIQSSKLFENGQSSMTTYNKFDFLTGQVLETTTTSSDGQSHKTKVIPAYVKYPEMGSKADNYNNKNMLSQTAANYSYIWDKNSNKWKETGVGLTTWNNLWNYKDIEGNLTSVNASAPASQKIWRKYKTYVWNGTKDENGMFTNYNSTTNSGDDNFNWTIGIGFQPAQWKQVSQVSLYDHFSAPVEQMDVNGNYNSIKMGDNDSKIMSTGNAAYSEMFYCGAENIIGTESTSSVGSNWLEPEIKMVNAKRNTSYFHTGKYSVEATSSSSFGVFIRRSAINGVPIGPASKYKVSVWVKKATAEKARLNINGTIEAFKESYTAGNWVLKTSTIDLPLVLNSVFATSADGTTVYFDDLMIRPLSSSIKGYVYNEYDELTHIIGNNGLAMRFEYDAAGKLIKTYSEIIDDASNGIIGGFKLSKSNTYNHKFL